MLKPGPVLWVLAVIVLGGGAYMLAAQNNFFRAGSSAGLFKPRDSAIVERGSAVYAANCASCHGQDLKGQPDWRSPGEDGLMPAPPHDENGHTWHHTDDMLFGITKYGVSEFSGLDGYKNGMPIFEDVLSDDEIIAALSYIKSRWPKEMQARHDEMNQIAEQNKARQ
tara:strand:- start:215 stop:715 length:501 start_codon:yes stop_codon:yes gene_type:complete